MWRVRGDWLGGASEYWFYCEMNIFYYYLINQIKTEFSFDEKDTF